MNILAQEARKFRQASEALNASVDVLRTALVRAALAQKAETTQLIARLRSKLGL